MWTLYEGDCFDYLPLIEDQSVDMVLCDLPYGTTACKWDTPLPLDKLWSEYERVIKEDGAIVLTASQPFTSHLVMSNPKLFRYELIWEKDKASNFFQAKKEFLKYHENVLVFSKKPTVYNPIMWDAGKLSNKRGKAPQTTKKSIYGHDRYYDGATGSNLRYPKSVIDFPTPKHNDSLNNCLHPTQKPVALFEYLVKTYTNPGDVVLDNCAGSGTTGVACENLNRDSILMEREPEYCNIIRNRLNELSSQTRLKVEA